MLDEKLYELHQTAKALAFDYYIRKGQIPEIITAIVGITESIKIFDEALRKYSADQPRIPAGNGRESGQWMDTGATGKPAKKKDPGTKPVTLNDGSTVKNPKTGKPLLMPKDVSLTDNARIGEDLAYLPFPAGDFAMVYMMHPNGPMDYQRLYDDGKFKRTYTDFGNYNFGVVAAAAGYSLDEAMSGAGVFNQYWSKNPDQSGVSGTDTSENTFIPMGYQDYTSGRITHTDRLP